MLSMQEQDMNLHANGAIVGNILNPTQLMSDINYIIKGPIPKLLSPKMLGFFVKLPKNTRADGMLTLEGNAKSDLLKLIPSIESKFTLSIANPFYDGWSARKVSVAGEWRRPVLAMTGAEVEFDEGGVKFSRIDYDSRADLEKISVVAKLENADFRKLLGPAVNNVFQIHMFLSGQLTSEIDLRNKIKVVGSTTLDITNFSFDNQKPNIVKPFKQLLSIPKMGLKAGFALDEHGARFSDTELKIDQTKLTATGKVDGSGMFDIDIRGPIKLEEIGKLSAFEIGGEGNLHWTIKGKKPHVLFSFDAQAKNTRYLNMNLGTVAGKIIYDDGSEILTISKLKSQIHRSEFEANGTVDLGKSDVIDVDILVPGATIPDLSFIFERFIRASVPWFPWDLNGRMDGRIKVSGLTDTEKLSVMGDMNLSGIEYRGEIFRGGRVYGGFRRGSYVAENIDIHKRYGRILGDIVFGSDDILKMKLRTENASTLDVDRLAALGIPYSAPLSIKIDVGGKWGALNGVVESQIGSGVIKGYPIGASRFRLDLGGARWKGNLAVFDTQFENTFDLGWTPGSESHVEFRANSFRFHPLLIGLNTGLASDSALYGNLGGSAKFSFKTGQVSRLTGDFALDSFVLRRTGYELALGAPVRFSLRNGNYDFTGAEIRSTALGGTQKLNIDGRVREGIINYKLDGGLHLRLLEFVTSEIAGGEGAAAIQARLSGAADAPNLDANLAVKKGYLRLSAVEQPFEEIEAALTVKDNRLAIQQITSRFAGGVVRAQGTALVHLTSVPEFEMSAEIENARVKVYPVTFARSTGKLHLKGSSLPYAVTGNIKVAEAMIRENFNLSEGSRILRSSKFMPSTTSGNREYSLFDLNINVVADRGILVKNELFDAELRGNLRVINSVKTPRLLGTVDVLSGKLLFKDSYFAIDNGNLRFTNPTVIDPEFDFSGFTEQKGYKVHLIAGGRVSDYKFNLTSQPPLSQNDIVNLLTLGVTSSEYQSLSRENRDAYSRDEVYGLLFNQSSINRGIKEKFGLNVRLDQAQVTTPDNVFRAKSADASENLAPKVVLQKQVTKRLSASVGTTVGVGDSQERSANLEYDIHRNWSVLGTYEDQRGAQLKQSRTSLGADLKFKMRFK